jgi:hypothetical protein
LCSTQINPDLADNFLTHQRHLFRRLQIDCAGGYSDSRPKIRLAGDGIPKAAGRGETVDEKPAARRMSKILTGSWAAIRPGNNKSAVLSIFNDLILWSRVDDGIPSLVAAPDGPEIRPLLSASVDTQLNALDADRDLFQAELASDQLRYNELGSVVQLYKALGGGWQ